MPLITLQHGIDIYWSSLGLYLYILSRSSDFSSIEPTVTIITKDYNFGGECVELLIKAMKECLRTGKWDSARHILRFVADLVNCHVISAG